jgi:hypothetical protein
VLKLNVDWSRKRVPGAEIKILVNRAKNKNIGNLTSKIEKFPVFFYNGE